MNLKRMGVFPRRRRVKASRLKAVVFCVFSAVIIGAAVLMSRFDDKVIPPVLAITEKTARNKVNAVIDEVVWKTAQGAGITSGDMYKSTSDENGMITSLEVDTVLVNGLCGALAKDISDGIADAAPQTVAVPFGTLLNINAFSGVGPEMPITVRPIGNALVDYETTFESVGINQINFQLWLKVDCYVRVTNPIQDEDILVSRRVALVNTVFSGKVPNTYLNNVPAAAPVLGE